MRKRGGGVSVCYDAEKQKQCFPVVWTHERRRALWCDWRWQVGRYDSVITRRAELLDTADHRATDRTGVISLCVGLAFNQQCHQNVFANCNSSFVFVYSPLRYLWPMKKHPSKTTQSLDEDEMRRLEERVNKWEFSLGGVVTVQFFDALAENGAQLMWRDTLESIALA